MSKSFPHLRSQNAARKKVRCSYFPFLVDADCPVWNLLCCELNPKVPDGFALNGLKAGLAPAKTLAANGFVGLAPILNWPEDGLKDGEGLEGLN